MSTESLINSAQSTDQTGQSDITATTSPGSTQPFTSPPFSTFRSFSGIDDRKDEKSPFDRLQDEPLQGYPLLAHYLTQRGYGIFRQFSHLTMHYLLYLQADILQIEEELDKLERVIAKSDVGDEKRTTFSLYHLDKYREANGTYCSKLHQLWMALGEKLDVYHKVLLQHHELSKLPVAGRTEVNDVWNFIRNNDLHSDRKDVRKKAMFMAFPENSVWKPRTKNSATSDPEKSAFSFHPTEGNKTATNVVGPPIEDDLVAINADSNPPIRFAEDLRNTLVKYYVDIFYRNAKKNAFGGYIVKGRVFQLIVDTFVLILSCVIPTISIIALYFIKSQVWRLGFISLWAAVFSLCLDYFTGATPSQVFSASLAMAATQVVFVSPSFNVSVS